MLRCVGLLSFLAAVCLLGETILEVYSGTTIQRIITMAAVGSCLLSAMYFVGTTSMPHDEGAWGAIGTATSCNVTGFLHTFGNLIFSFYDMFLSITYVLVVRYNWSDKCLVQIERIVHPTVWLVAAFVSGSAIATKSFGADWDTCWVTARECETSVEDLCDRRGSKGKFFLIALFMFQIVMIVVSVSCMVTIYCTVKVTEQRSMRHSFQWADNTDTIADERMAYNKNSSIQENGTVPRGRGLLHGSSRKVKEVGIQGMFYAGTTLFCFLPVTIFVALFSNSPAVSNWVRNDKWGSLISYAMLYLYGMHGVCYLYVFMRKRPHPKTAYGRFWRRILFEWSCCKREDPQQTTTDTDNNNTPL